MWACNVLWPAVLLAQSALALPPREAIVYPYLLESREGNGDRILRISDGLTLTLEHKPAYSDYLLLVTSQEDGTQLHRYEPASYYNEDLFQDRKHMASLMVSQGDEGLHVNGIIGEELRIKPAPQMERSSEGHVPHLFYREKPSSRRSRFTDYVSMPVAESGVDSGPQDPVVVTVITPVNETSTRTVRTVERADGKVVSEVHLVIDSTYLKAYKNSQAKVITYFGVVLNAVNLRYETVTVLNVRIKIVGFTFNKRTDMEPYFQPFHGNKDYVGAEETLQAFNKHMELNHPAVYGKVDAVFLVTGRTLAVLENGAVVTSVRGLAYIGGVCTRFKVGLGEDVPWSYDAVRILSHEVAHTLGCVHDGDGPSDWLLQEGSHPGAKDCPWSSGFLMSYVQQNNSQYRFSPCCGRQMLFLSKLKSRACLLTEGSTNALPSLPKRLPGSRTPLNAICKKAFAKNGKVFSYDTTQPLKGCKIKCATEKYQVEKDGKRYWSWNVGETSSLEGSPCDSSDTSKVCIRNECLSRREFSYDSTVIPTTTTEKRQ